MLRMREMKERFPHSENSPDPVKFTYRPYDMSYEHEL